MIHAKYPIRIGKLLIPKGEQGRVATLDEARTIFPNIEYREGSVQVAVVFRDLPPCVVHKDQIDEKTL